MEEYVVYWIKLKNHLDINSEGYVGISHYYSGRGGRKWRHFNCLKNNSHKNPILQNAYNFYGAKAFEISVVFNGSFKECQDKEISLRPSECIGWNVFAGGGYPPNHKGKHRYTNGIDNVTSYECPNGYFQGVTKKSNKPHGLKGRPKPKSQVEKMRKSLSYKRGIKILKNTFNKNSKKGSWGHKIRYNNKKKKDIKNE